VQGNTHLLIPRTWVPMPSSLMLQVSGFALMMTDDAKRLAQYWLKYTEDVRNDDQASGRWLAVVLTA